MAERGTLPPSAPDAVVTLDGVCGAADAQQLLALVIHASHQSLQGCVRRLQWPSAAGEGVEVGAPHAQELLRYIQSVFEGLLAAMESRRIVATLRCSLGRVEKHQVRRVISGCSGAGMQCEEVAQGMARDRRRRHGGGELASGRCTSLGAKPPQESILDFHLCQDAHICVDARLFERPRRAKARFHEKHRLRYRDLLCAQQPLIQDTGVHSATTHHAALQHLRRQRQTQAPQPRRRIHTSRGHPRVIGLPGNVQRLSQQRQHLGSVLVRTGLSAPSTACVALVTPLAKAALHNRSAGVFQEEALASTSECQHRQRQAGEMRQRDAGAIAALEPRLAHATGALVEDGQAEAGGDAVNPRAAASLELSPREPDPHGRLHLHGRVSTPASLSAAPAMPSELNAAGEALAFQEPLSSPSTSQASQEQDVVATVTSSLRFQPIEPDDACRAASGSLAATPHFADHFSCPVSPPEDL
eukprot:scaffold451_cov208-Pinguiococcus_pyrenoidosus.AAC.5